MSYFVLIGISFKKVLLHVWLDFVIGQTIFLVTNCVFTFWVNQIRGLMSRSLKQVMAGISSEYECIVYASFASC